MTRNVVRQNDFLPDFFNACIGLSVDKKLRKSHINEIIKCRCRSVIFRPLLLLAYGIENNGRGSCDIKRIHAVRHGNFHGYVALRDCFSAQSVAFGSEYQSADLSLFMRRTSSPGVIESSDSAMLTVVNPKFLSCLIPSSGQTFVFFLTFDRISDCVSDFSF